MDSKPFYDVIFCIYGCLTVEKYKNQLLKLQDTWGLKATSMNYKVLYFLGEEKTEYHGEEFVYLNGVSNDYISASYKQNLGLKYIHDNYNYNFVFS